MADNNTILEKLEGLVARFEEVSTLITDPAVIADQKRYVKLTKEYKELGDLMDAGNGTRRIGCLSGTPAGTGRTYQTPPRTCRPTGQQERHPRNSWRYRR